MIKRALTIGRRLLAFGSLLKRPRLNTHKMSNYDKDVPFGVQFLQRIVNRCCPNLVVNRTLWYRSSVLILTYIAYMCYHMSRKPISVVKSVLHRTNCSALEPPSVLPPGTNKLTWCDWAPFDGSDAQALSMFGEIDSAFLFAYAGAMFFSGFVAERVNLRYFLSLGMIMSGFYCYLFGIAEYYNIHRFSYFMIVQIGAGIFQTTGWPGVVTVVGNWCGKSKRGLTFGIWNSHTSIGNILGSLIAGAFVETNWSLSFIYPGLIMGCVGFLMFLFLVASPDDVGCSKRPQQRRSRQMANQVANRDIQAGDSSSDSDDIEVLTGDQEIQRRYTEKTHLLRNQSTQPEERAIGFIGACKIPGVIEYSFSLFFSKLVSYTFLYWLPFYIQHSTSGDATYSADISTLFDVGGIFGAIAAGAISDYSNMSATTCTGMLFLAIPAMFIYQAYASVSLSLSYFLLVLVGILVNGPYALITTAVSAELGTHSSLGGNSKALATVTAIIDGTGSIGAAVGPLLAGFVMQYGWQCVFYMLMLSDVIAMALLFRLVLQEITRYRRRGPIRIE